MKEMTMSTTGNAERFKKTSPPAQEKDSHKKGGESGKFLGDTKGNKVLPVDRSDKGGEGSAGDSHSTGGSKSPFLGETKGNKDLPADRSSGTGGGQGGRYIASNDRYHGGRSMSKGGN
jgi:hypothetical protein